MNAKKLIEDLDALQDRALNSQKDFDELSEIKKDTFVLIKQYFGENSIYLKMLNDIDFSFSAGEDILEQELRNCVQKYSDLMDMVISELKSSQIPKIPLDNSVFIVHGTAQESVKELKTILENVGIKPIILHEQPSKGMTIIEKLEKYSDVGFALVILTPDDVGGFCLEDKKHGLYSFEKLRKRARQNVILEFGYFIGRLGRNKVCCLYKGDIELPSDMHGICYVHFENSIQEVEDIIIKELKAAEIIN